MQQTPDKCSYYLFLYPLLVSLCMQFSEQPLVPIGCVATAYFLVSGIKSFKDRDPLRSQKMMRARVGAQFLTLVVFFAYLGKDQFDLRLAPSYQDKKARERETLERQQQQQQQQN